MFFSFFEAGFYDGFVSGVKIAESENFGANVGIVLVW